MGQFRFCRYELRKMIFKYFVALIVKPIHNKILITIWALSTFIISNYIVNDIQALLVSIREKRIETFQELVEKTDITAFAVQKSYFMESL